MLESYRILYQGGSAEIVEKKSRFIASLRPVKTEEEAQLFVEEMKKKYWDAAHNCFAYAIGEKNEIVRGSDDGEPAQTAGKPMLEVLLGEGIHDACVVVTRYFGGTLLGTGGLVRAYQKAVQEGLKASVILDKCPGKKMRITTDYNVVGKLQYLLGQMELVTLESSFMEQVQLSVLLPLSLESEVLVQVREATAGKSKIETGEVIYFAMLEKSCILL